MPKVASPSFVSPLRQKRFVGRESTTEGRQPWGEDTIPLGLKLRETITHRRRNYTFPADFVR